MENSGGGIGNVTPNAALVQMAMGYARSRMLVAAARLGVADALGDEVRRVEELAVACQANEDALYRLLRALASIGVTEETAARQFRLTALGRPLQKDVADSAWAAVVFWGDLLADEWSLLTECVRTGKNAAEVRDPRVQSRFAQDPESGAIFRAVMGTAPAEDYAPIARAWDFSRARVVADLGGGGGALILAVLDEYPQVRGLLVDREASVEAARGRFAKEKHGARCELVVADLMEAVPEGADVYLLKHVLHGCDDAEAVTLLRNVRAVMPEDGTLLAIEFILPAVVGHADPQLEVRLMSDLNMLAVTGGRERSEREWKVLLEAAGFRLAGVHAAGGELGIVEARVA
ncbi:MAG: methyltransferase [Acidobacteriaceae bacterium]